MKTLCLVRHAKSSWDNPGIDDFDRPLNDRGEKDAPRMGKCLKEREVVPSLIYSSPAVRALATSKIIAGVLGYPLNGIRTPRRLYHADEETFLEIVNSVPEENDCIIMTGHNPGLTDFANNLLDEKIDNIPTSGVVAAQLGINSWKEAKWGCGKLLFFDYPKNH